MQQLSGLDAAFLYLETDNAPMHIGGISLLDGETPDGPLTLESLRQLMASRLDVARTFRQRLAPVPLNLGRPYWVDEAQVDIEHHVQRTQLPEPGNWTELHALMAWEFSQPLDRNRPLWQLLFVEGLRLDGLPEARVALISRVHHAAIDGVSGAEILGALFDATPNPERETPPSPSLPEKEPGGLRLLRMTGRNLARYYGAIPGAVSDALKSAARSGLTWGLKGIQPPPLPFVAPRTRFNGPISRRRVWSGKIFSLDRVKALRKTAVASFAADEGKDGPKTTVNDVVLAICSGALRKLLESQGELPEKPLVAMAPISVRDQEERKDMGNQVSAMLVSLATDVAGSRDRLRAIHRGATGSKIYHQAVGARTLTDSAQFIPFSVAGLAARLYTRLHLAQRHRPLFNVVITNVPGPQVPLYVGGSRLLAHIGAAPVFDGVGLILPVFSYNGTLGIGIVSCQAMLPEVRTFADLLEEAFTELEEAFSD